MQVAPICRIAVHAVPGAKMSSIAGMHGDAVRVRIQAPPVDGKANRALLDFLADTLSLKSRDLSLVKGECGRDKLIEIRGLDRKETLRRMGL